MFRLGSIAVALLFIAVFAYAAINPRTTPYMISETRRLDNVAYQWVAIDNIAPVMARSVVAAEDANFCNHWGFDMVAIRQALSEGSNRGASTISQQVAKNAYLWQGRSWVRKALEALFTPAIETVWTKRRILEVYLNIVEFDEGVFGIDAASRSYFNVKPHQLTAIQAGRLAAILPSPKRRSASNPTNYIKKRGRSIAGGAATILADGRAKCFES